MRTLLHRLALWLTVFLSRWTKPDDLTLVLYLTLHTASLELKKSEYLELAPMKGCCGPIRLSGNSLPVFEYLMFEKKIMEFVRVRVEVSKPDRIHYTARIDCRGTKGVHENAEKHGQEVEVIDRYKEPFRQLAFRLYNYFPFYAQPFGKEKNPYGILGQDQEPSQMDPKAAVQG